jgi:hypothetical protein
MKMARQFYSKRHWARVCPKPDTAAEVETRIRRNAALIQAAKETAARFNPITPANAAEAIAWQEQRFLELNSSSK